MTDPTALRASADFAALLAVSERAGRDPLQVQGPGGNTSLKRDGIMAIKASGTWLAEARERPIMVTVDQAGLLAALEAGDTAAEDAPAFRLDDPENGDLRPSIETTVHAVFPHPVVLHTHCVETIALAVRADAEAETAARLVDLDAVFVPYVKPGADLARAIRARLKPGTRVIVLGNHGLVAGGASAAEAEALLHAVAERLSGARAAGMAAGMAAAAGFAESLAGTGWRPVDHPETQAVARDPARLARADGATLYPDHLIFLGPGVAIARTGETAAEAAARAAASAPPHGILIVPDQGVAIPDAATPSVIAMARALGDVLARIAPGAALTRIAPEEEAALLNWDAEKHRQALEAARAAR